MQKNKLHSFFLSLFNVLSLPFLFRVLSLSLSPFLENVQKASSNKHAYGKQTQLDEARKNIQSKWRNRVENEESAERETKDVRDEGRGKGKTETKPEKRLHNSGKGTSRGHNRTDNHSTIQPGG